MSVTVNFQAVPDAGDFSLVPIGKYPARLVVDAYQKDAQGNPMTGPDGQPAYRRTQAGDTMWNLEWHLLADGYAERHILDNMNFTPGGLKRVKVMYVRGGFATGQEENISLDPDDLHGTYWWIDVEHPDPADALREGQSLKEAKYTFKAGKCSCATCRKYDGQKVNVYAKVTFAGMEPMKADDVVEFTHQAADRNGMVSGVCGEIVCAECLSDNHWHKEGAKGCMCENEQHPPF